MRKLPPFLLVILAVVPAASSPLLVNAIQGVYKVRHNIAMYDGSLPPGQFHTVEDVLEIVALPHGNAYLRLDSAFDNGHSCKVYGVAKPEGDALIYRPHDNIEGECALTLQRKGGNLVFGDKDSACKYDYCGMRGSFEGASFPISSRRPIRYMPRLLASREYAEALAEQGMTAPPPKIAVKVEPMQATGPVARYPRLTVFPDKTIRGKVNALLAKEEAEMRSDWKDCVAFLHPAAAKSFNIDMRVTYVTPRYINVTQTANHNCAGAVGNTAANPATIDLSTAEYVDWRIAFKPGFFYGINGEPDGGQLDALYRARVTLERPECREALKRRLSFVLWLDAVKGLMVEPESITAEGCHPSLALSPKDIAPYVQDARLVADLKATVRNWN
jgi:hypothetical protein